MRKWLFRALVAVFASIFLISGYVLIRDYLQGRKEQAEFDRLAQIVEQARNDNEQNNTTQFPQEPDSDPTQPTEPVLVEVKNSKTGKTEWILKDYAELYAQNSDLAGWISIDGTNINYPVMYRPNVLNYYLYRGFNEKWSNAGSLYIREACNPFTPTDNVVIYGHNMKNKTMFYALNNYTQKNFWQEHKYIRFDTVKEYHTYEIVAVFKTTANDGGFDYHLFVNAENEEKFNEYIQKCKDLAFYETGVTAQYGDKLIVLSTCEYTLNNGRLVVLAKRVSE